MILDTLLSINHWFHLSAAALLAGGMIFLVAILRPVLGRKLICFRDRRIFK